MATLPPRCAIELATRIGLHEICPSDAASSPTPTSPRTLHLNFLSAGYFLQPRKTSAPGGGGGSAAAPGVRVAARAPAALVTRTTTRATRARRRRMAAPRATAVPLANRRKSAICGPPATSWQTAVTAALSGWHHH